MEGKSSDWRPGPTVCRCCLSEGCYKDISTEYFWMGKREVYAEMLSETLDLSIAYSNSSGPNSNSRLICEQCIARLRDASEFKRQVVDCEKTFMQHLNPASSSKSRDFAALSESIGEVKVELVKREKESLSDDDDFNDNTDFLDVDTDDDLDNQPLTKLASKVPKKEVDILDLLDASQITVKRKSNLKSKEPPKKVLKKKETKAVSKPAPKPVEKKKDDDWTTTDVSITPVEFDYNVAARVKRSPSDEWITTDIADHAESTASIEQSAADDEWVTCSLDAADNPPSASEPYYCVDKEGSEWVITDLLKKQLKPRDSTISETVETNTQYNAKEEQDSSNVVISSSGGSIAKWRRIHIRGAGDMWLKVSKCVVNKQKPKRGTGFRTFLNNTDIPTKTEQNAVLILRNTTAIPYGMENFRSIIPCFACDNKFMDPFLFRDHFIAEHQTVDKAKGIYSRIVQPRVDITDLSCLLCAQLLDTLDQAASHLVREHQIPIDLNERLGLVPLKFTERGLCKCVICNKKFCSYRELYRHTGTHFAYNICEKCGKQFESPRSLELHIKTKHISGRMCKKCRVIFPTGKDLKQHIKDVRSCSPGYCKVCDKSYGYWQELQKHREEVHGYPKKVYSCSVCQKVLDKRMQLYFHFKQEHTDFYKCKVCNKKVCGPTTLKRHMRIHAGLSTARPRKPKTSA